MSAASNYTENNIIDAIFGETAFPLPAALYISLHTANPGETGGSEVSTSDWPSYVRKDAADGGALSDGWTRPGDGTATNAKQIIYPSNNGAGNVTVTHWAIYDASTGGNLICYAPLNTPRTIQPQDVFVFDIGAITIQQV